MPVMQDIDEIEGINEMFNINRAQIKIEISDYIKGIKEHPEYIDGSNVFFESGSDLLISSYKDIEEAESEIDPTVYLTITENEAVLEYEYISGAENVYFNKVNFMGNIYPVTTDLKSPSCYKAIIKYLKLHNGVEANED